MARYLPNTINSVLFTLYGLLGIALGVLLLDGYASFGSFSPPSDASMTSVPRGVDIGIGMIFLTMGALGIVVGYQLWKSRISGLMMGLPLLLAGVPIAAFFALVEASYREFNVPALFLGLDLVMVVLIVASWKPLRNSERFEPRPKPPAEHRSFTSLAAAMVIAAIVISASFLSYTSFETTETVTTTATITTTSMTTAEATGPGGVVSLMKVNGSYYWADDVSRDIVIGSPGYSYFLNGSVTFDGVKFQTICPASYRGCPGSNSSSTIIWAYAISFNVTFPDKTTEQVGYAGLGTYNYLLSNTLQRRVC